MPFLLITIVLLQYRNSRAPNLAIKENRERRLKEAAEIVKLITSA